jgi:hypothetical protein
MLIFLEKECVVFCLSRLSPVLDASNPVEAVKGKKKLLLINTIFSVC